MQAQLTLILTTTQARRLAAEEGKLASCTTRTVEIQTTQTDFPTSSGIGVVTVENNVPTVGPSDEERDILKNMYVFLYTDEC